MRGREKRGWVALGGLLALGALSGCKGEAAPADADDPTKQPILSFGCEDDGDCSDGLFCNGVEHCQDTGLCGYGEAPECDDGIGCTTDTCDERIAACRHDPPDADADGHSDGACQDATGNPLGDDCDDADPGRFPGNTEVCDANHHDEDCDFESFGAEDADGDGHLNANCCNVDAEGAARCGDDCDDGRAAAFPGNTEVCDAIDNDCNGLLDHPIEDVDGDGYATVGCGGNDCDDHNPDIYAGAHEICDGLDSDCSSGGGVEPQEQDLDTDGFVVGQCLATQTLAPGDCDDVQRASHPTADEVCDGRDNDCDALIDERPAGCGHGIREVIAGGRNSMIVHLDGRVSAWGDNPVGFNNTTATESTPRPLYVRDAREPDGLLAHVRSVAVSASYACAVHRDGRVSCWGLGVNGRLGNGVAEDRVFAPVDIGLGDIVGAAAGLFHACAFDRSGAVYCWGYNAQGQLGDGTLVQRVVPVRLEGFGGVTDIAAGERFTCATQDTGRVYCWGSNDNGQLGDTTFNDRNAPGRVFGIDDAVQVACGSHTACAVHADRTVSCWGSNEAGQQGGDEPVDAPRPARVLDTTGRPLGGVVDVTVSGDRPVEVYPEIGTSCARLADGRLMCWGTNEWGQLGVGMPSFDPSGLYISSTTHAEYPVLTGRPRNWAELETLVPFRATQVSGGEGHLCATNEAGLAHCWGRDGNYELGQDVSYSYPGPVEDLP